MRESRHCLSFVAFPCLSFPVRSPASLSLYPVLPPLVCSRGPRRRTSSESPNLFLFSQLHPHSLRLAPHLSSSADKSSDILQLVLLCLPPCQENCVPVETSDLSPLALHVLLGLGCPRGKAQHIHGLNGLISPHACPTAEWAGHCIAQVVVPAASSFPVLSGEHHSPFTTLLNSFLFGRTLGNATCFTVQ